jgi:hypothetical protein
MDDIEMECTINDTEVSVTWWCRGCDEKLTMVVDPLSGVVDWGAEGDFGCNGQDSDDEGVASHLPVLDDPTFREYWANHG